MVDFVFPRLICRVSFSFLFFASYGRLIGVFGAGELGFASSLACLLASTCFDLLCGRVDNMATRSGMGMLSLPERAMIVRYTASAMHERHCLHIPNSRDRLVEHVNVVPS